MCLPLEMHDYTWMQLLKDNPEWATVIFAGFTMLIILWQVVVMIVQGRATDRREQQQNGLIRLQLYHGWLIRMNAEREKILHMAEEVRSAAGCLTIPPMTGGETFWDALQEKTYELRKRLRILDMGAYTGQHDAWYFELEEYIDRLQEIISEDREFQDLYKLDQRTPVDSTRAKLKEANDRHNPTDIFLEIEKAMRLESLDFSRSLENQSR